ncbi:MAG: hypothetical protein HY616_13235, partial [Candidatus Rokubacteria bacterium]|nr:hypothetical protein [Candidatus Rokubacteria bacterium]
MMLDEPLPELAAPAKALAPTLTGAGIVTTGAAGAATAAGADKPPPPTGAGAVTAGAAGAATAGAAGEPPPVPPPLLAPE